MNTIQSYLEKFGGNFLVAAFVPSLAFVAACVLLFGPVVPQDVLLRIQSLFGPLAKNNMGWLIFLAAVIIGFTLTSLNTFIYKLFEGYVFTVKLSFFRTNEMKRARQYRSKREIITKKIKRLQNRLDLWEKTKMPARNKKERHRIEIEIQNLKSNRDDISADYDQSYPPHEKLVLPTRFGNILRASETYPLERWGIDAVTMWPRLIYAVSTAPKGEEYLAKVDIANDQCSFLLNSSLLSVLYAGLALLVSVYQCVMLYLQENGIPKLFYFIPVDSQPTIYLQRILIYFIVSLLAVGLFWFFYKASLYNVSQYGNMIRSTYDLFHLRLLKTLRLDELSIKQIPNDTKEEKQKWEVISEYIAMGNINSLGDDKRSIYFEYDASDEYAL
jgi:hypothetical protein